MGEWCPTMPPWVRRILVGRGHALNVMARTVFEGLWFCAPVSRSGEMFDGPVNLGRWTPTIPELAEANGVSEVSAAKALRLLICVGWVTRKGRSIVLAWQAPHEFGGLAVRSSGSDQAIPEDRSILEDPIPEDRPYDPRVTPTRSSGNTESILEDRPLNTTTPYPKLPQLPPSTSAEPTSSPTPVGEQFALIPPEADEDLDALTPAKIRTWWAEVYLPLRAATLDKYRPGSAKNISCSDSRLKAIRARISENCVDEPWAEQRERLTHVVRNAAARVHEHGGAKTSWNWKSLDAIQPKHWLDIEGNFRKYYEDTPAYGDRGMPTRDAGFPAWMDRREEVPLSSHRPEDL